MHRRLLLAAALLFAATLSAQNMVTVTASHVTDISGNPITGHIYFQPTTALKIGGGGQASGQPVIGLITNGAFSISVADTSQASPANACYNVYAVDSRNNTVFGSSAILNTLGYQCVQVANSWCSGGTCNFDNYAPNLTAAALSQLTTLTLTTNGSSGAATLINGVLNIPPYSGGSGSSGNATQFNGVTISGTPTDGQAYVYSAANSEFLPVAVPYWKKVTVGYGQLTGFNALTGTVTLWARASRQKVCGVSMYTTAAFAGSGIGSISVTVGDSNSTANLYTPQTFSVTDNGSVDDNVMGAATGSSNITATFTATGANLSSLSSGSVDIDLCLANTP